MADNTTSFLLRLEQQDKGEKKAKKWLTWQIRRYFLETRTSEEKKTAKVVSPLAERDYACSNMKPLSKTAKDV